MATANNGTVSASDDGSVNSTIADAHAKKLPKAAQAKIKALSRAWAKSGHMRTALYNAQRDAHARRAELSLHADHLRRTIELGNGPVGGDDHRRLAELDSERADCATEIAELAAEMAALPSPFNPEGITAWLAANGGKRFRTIVPVVNLRKGQTPLAALNDIRGEISDAVESIEAVRNAPLPSSDSIANAVAEIERIAAKGAPYFGRCRLTEPGIQGRTRVGEIRWPKWFDPEGMEHGDAFSMLVALNKNALIAQATAELQKLDEPDEAMSIAARKPRIAEIEALILGLERKEAILIEMAAAQGETVSYRPSMNVMAILQIEPNDAALPVAVPETDAPDDPKVIAADVRRARLRDPAVRSERKAMSDAAESEFG